MRWLLAAILPIAAGCSNDTLGPYILQPLPGGKLPASQTIESGVQLRLTNAGFGKVSSNATALLSAQVDASTVCIPKGSTALADYCTQNDGPCTLGCQLHPHVMSAKVSVTNVQTVHVVLHFSASATVPVALTFPLAPCVAMVSASDIQVDFDVTPQVDPTSGELGYKASNVQSTLTGVSATGCGSLSSLATLAADILNTTVSGFVTDSLLPLVQSELSSLTPKGGGGTLDARALLTGITGDPAMLEKNTPLGGYASFANQGVSLGVITGFNADSDPTTRTTALTSEPAACVANLPALDLSAAPFSLPITARGTYSLPPAGAFAGAPDPASDVVIGVSERALDLAGHHAVASGAFCVTLDATSSPSLHRDALDDLLGVPLAASGDAPLRVVMQPKSALDFSLVDSNQVDAKLAGLGLSLDFGDADAGFSPALALTSDVTLHFALEPRRDASGPLELEPIVLKMDATTPAASALDPRYQGISAGDRASFLSSADDLVFATVGPAETRFALPTTVATMSLGSLQFQRVTTTQSSFLAILGTLTPPPGAPPGTPAAKPVPKAVSVVESDPASVRDALRGLGGALPEVHVQLSDTGLEHSWRVHGGAWRPWQSGAELVISDRSFAWQGARVLELRSRTDFTSTSATASVNVVIDYAPPTLFGSQAVVTATTVTVPARDAVSPAGALQRAVTAVGAPAPTSGFVTSESVPLGALATEKDVVVYVRDEAGHTASTTVHLRGVPEAGSDAASGGASHGEGGTPRGAGGSASVSHADAGAAPGAAGDAGADAAAHPKGAASDNGGCGCRTTSQGSPRGATFGLLALAALLGRTGRRRSRRSLRV